MKFEIEMEHHDPSDKTRPCDECILSVKKFACLDRSYCEFRETGKTWKVKKNIRKVK